MAEEKDKFDELLDWIEPGKEPTDEELASFMQDGEAMSDFKDAQAAQQAINRHVAAEEGLPFDLDQEWTKVSAMMKEEETSDENLSGDSGKPQEENAEAMIEEMPRKRFSKPLYIIIGVAASLLLIFIIDKFFLASNAEIAVPQNTACVFQRDTTAAQFAILTSSDSKTAPQVLQGQGIIMPKSEQQPAASAITRILHAIGFEQDEVALQNNTVTIPAGKSYNITLADGTNVFMYAGSRLTYPVAFSGKERRVYLEGEAYFKVTKDKQHPFVISTEKAEAKVLGTDLNVACYKGEPCHVALLTGSVLVSNKKESRFVKLVPGQGVTVNADAPLSICSESMDTYNYWLSGYIYYDDTALAEIAKSLGRWYNVNVVFDNEEMKSLKVRYFCQRSESLERAVELLNSYGKFKVSIEGETLHIK
jgi:transmembrane sensor